MHNVRLRNLTDLELKSIRDGFGEGFLSLGATHPDVVGLSADLTESVRMHKFAEKYPDRFFQCGIQEQNMAGVATGLALSGKVAYMGSFGNFSPARNFDQIRTSICMMNSNVKIIASHTGFTHGSDGITVQMLEDVGILRTLPNMTVIVPADADQAAAATAQAALHDGPVYIRLGRSETPLLFEDATDFKIGEAQLLREGTDVSIFANGYMVFRALIAAELLKKEGIDAQVVNVHTVKPLSANCVLAATQITGAAVTAEEHQITGGLGDAVSSLLSRNHPIPLEMVAVNDQFGETASDISKLYQKYGLMETDIVNAAKRVVSRKHNAASQTPHASSPTVQM